MESNGELKKNGLKKRRRGNTNLRNSIGRNFAVRLPAMIRSVDEIVIGVPVPRKYRSPSMRRLNANLSFRKSKSLGPKSEVPRGVGYSSMLEDDVENEVVEALFDLMNQSHLEDCKSKKKEMDEEPVTNKKCIKTSHLAHKSDLFGRNDKVVDKGMGVSAPNDDLIGKDENNVAWLEYEPMQLETLLPAPTVNVSVGKEKAFDKRCKELFDDSKRIASKKRMVAPQDEDYSLPANQNSDNQVDSILLEGNSAAEVIETKRKAKFQIALMDVASDDNKVMGQHVQMIKIADKVGEKGQEEIKVEPSYLRQGYAQPEKSASTCSGKSELVEDRKEPNQCKAIISGAQKFALPTSLPFPIFGVGWPRGLPHPGYIPPFQIVMPGFPHAPLLSQPRRKRCATHQYIAHNILVHQQLIMNLTTPPATAGPGTTYKAKTPTLDALLTKQIKTDEDVSRGEFLGKTMFSAIDDKTFGAGKNVNVANNMQLMFQQAFRQIPTANVLAPDLQHYSLMVPPINQTVETLSANSVKGPVRSSSSSPVVSYNHINFSSKAVSPNMAIFPNNANAFPFSTSSTEKQTPAMMPFVNGPYYSSPTFYVSQTQLQQ